MHFRLKLGFLFLVILSLLVLIGCVGGDNGEVQTPGIDTEAFKGTEGISLKFQDDRPLIVSPEDEVNFIVEAENKGRTNTQLYFLLSGPDEAYLEYEEVEKDSGDELRGKSQFGDGELRIFDFSGVVTDEIKGAIFPLDTNIDVCYEYQLQHAFPICLDADGRQYFSGRQGDCPNEKTYTFSEGQGGPLIVEKVYYSARRKSQDEISVRFTIYFDIPNLVDNLVLLDSEKVEGACSEEGIQDRDLGKIKIGEGRDEEVESIMLGDTELTCYGLDEEGYFRTYRGKEFKQGSRITCVGTIDKGSDYTTELKIGWKDEPIKYGVKQRITKQIKFERLIQED